MIAVLVTVVWAAATFTFNSVAGTDYAFLNGKPHTASLLEVPKEQPPEQRTPDTPQNLTTDALLPHTSSESAPRPPPRGDR
jgi:hypothetical protein